MQVNAPCIYPDLFGSCKLVNMIIFTYQLNLLQNILLCGEIRPSVAVDSYRPQEFTLWVKATDGRPWLAGPSSLSLYQNHYYHIIA